MLTSGVRDYIHVSDLAEGHVAALTKLHDSTHGCETFNLGTGVGYSVLEMVQAFENASGRKVNYEVYASMKHPSESKLTLRTSL